jgi:opacity protein-like surface antigen
MNLNLTSVRVAAGCCLALLTSPVVAQDKERGFYFDANVGVALAEDVELKSFIVPTRGVDLELDPGPRLSVAGGYNFCSYFGLQAETGFIFNEIDGSDGDAVLSHVPLLLDAVFRYDKPNSRFVPYIGAGAGGDFSSISFDDARFGGGWVDGSDSSLVFAWQVFAGLRFKLNDRMSIGGGYKYFDADGAEWDVEHTSGDIETDRAKVHSVMFDFNMKF